MRTNQHVYGERAFWVKGEEARMIKDRKLTVIIRPDDRSDSILAPKQWLPLNKPIPVYTIDVPGDQTKGIAAKFAPDDGTTVKVVRRTVGRLSDITYSDLQFNGGTAVPTTVDGVTDYLASELAPGREFRPDTLMTIYWLEYLPNEDLATD